MALTHYLERFDPVAQKAVWGKLFKDRKQFLQMIEPDNPDDDKKEVKRRKKRDEYFKKLDELMLDKKNLTEIEEIT